MSTSVATPTLSFLPSLKKEKPGKICGGRITSVGPAYISEREGASKKYYTVRIDITALGTGSNQAIFWCFRPEYFNANMTRSDLREMAELDKGVYFMYGKNIAADEEQPPSTLQGLCGSPEVFQEVATRLLTLGVDAITETPTLVSDVLRTYFVEENPQHVVGYVVGQQQVRTDDIDPDTGKNIYVPGKWMEIKSYWHYDGTQESIDRQARRAEKSKGKLQLAFNGETF
jgi:hypothetical protein